MKYLIITYLLNIADYLFTADLVRKFGIEIEGNPFGRWLFENNIAGLFKIVVVGAIFAVIGYIIKKHPKAIIAAYILLGVFALLVIYHIVIAVMVWNITHK